MKISTLLLALEEALRTLAEPAGGVVEVCGSPADALAKLANAPDRWRLLVGWDGGNPQGEFGSTDKTRLQVIVQAPRGLQMEAGRDVVGAGSGADLALLDRVDTVQRWVRSFRFYADEALTTRHAGVDPCHGLVPGAVQWLGDPNTLNPTRDAVLTFTILRALPEAQEIAVSIPTTE